MPRSKTIAIAFLVFLPASAPAFHHVTPPVVQITPLSSAGTIANQQWAGIRFVIFDSDADLLGSGSTGHQIYLFDLLERDLHHTQALFQLTSGLSGLDDNRHGTSGKLANAIVYDARPSGAGPHQLFMFDRRHGDRYALTEGTADSVNARMDHASRMVVFESDANFFATGNAGRQIYQIDLRKVVPSCPYPCGATGNAGLTQITRSAGTNRNAVTSNNGKLIAFESDADPMGIGENTTQVYTYDGETASFAALSHGPGASRNPSISLNGRLVAFESGTDLLKNGTMGTQIFVHKRAKALPQQISDHRPIGHCTGASLSANGHAVSFVSSDDLLSSGSTGSEVFSYDLQHQALRQITDSQSPVSTAAYAGGVFITFLSADDLLGTNPNSVALYLVNLFALGAQTIP